MNKKRLSIYLSREEQKAVELALGKEEMGSLRDLALALIEMKDQPIITDEDQRFFSLQLRGAASNCTKVINSPAATNEERQAAEELRDKVYRLREVICQKQKSKRQSTVQLDQANYWDLKTFLDALGYDSFGSFVKNYFVSNGLLLKGFETPSQKLTFKRRLHHVCNRIFSEVEFLVLEMNHQRLVDELKAALAELEEISEILKKD